MKKLTGMGLDEMAHTMQIMSEIDQGAFIGGGVGTANGQFIEEIIHR